ncbi:MAG: hypothetical protein Q4F74_02430 [Synergistaceae bacterium]|nr:hypothetical protein [Synergistaceae bacterium]
MKKDERVTYTLRLDPNIAIDYKIALAKRRDKAQFMLKTAVIRYIEETRQLEEEGHL